MVKFLPPTLKPPVQILGRVLLVGKLVIICWHSVLLVGKSIVIYWHSVLLVGKSVVTYWHSVLLVGKSVVTCWCPGVSWWKVCRYLPVSGCFLVESLSILVCDRVFLGGKLEVTCRCLGGSCWKVGGYLLMLMTGGLQCSGHWSFHLWTNHHSLTLVVERGVNTK